MSSTKELENLKQEFEAFPKSDQGLDVEIESIIKHLKNYKKILSPHFQELETVLQLEAHQEAAKNISHAEPIQQIKTLFKILKEDDIDTLENLRQAIDKFEEPKTISSPETTEAFSTEQTPS